VYPAGTASAPVVVVIHGGGYGFNDWVRAVADQLAQEGFIALAPDLISGMGPNGGNTDAFEFPDDVLKTIGKLGPNALVRVGSSRLWRQAPRANGKGAIHGFCLGGGLSFQMAAEGVNAAVVYYGGPPRPETMEKITAPVIGFYGGDDARLTSSVEPARAAMAKLGKSYEPRIYRHATHAFLEFQDLSDNFIATKDAWPRAVAFLKAHTK
jgi:carboxymethylenebutenolidase